MTRTIALKTLVPTIASLSLCLGSAAIAFDLSELPSYEPKERVSGSIRIWGNDTMEEVTRYWEEGFRKHHPQVKFDNNLATTAIAVPALSVGVADIGAMGREVWPIELISYLKVHKGTPVTVPVAGGTFDVENKTWALTVFVHKDNPIAQLTMEQLDGIFGAERTGRWDKTKSRWIVDPRGAEKNIRTWGQLGLKGEWADKPIQTYGFDLTSSGFSFFFADRVFGGADKWNENLKEYVGLTTSDGKFIPSPPQVTAAMNDDRYAIGYSGMQYRTSNLKPLAIAPFGSKNYVTPSKRSAQDMTYPLSRSLYFLANRSNGGSLDPKVKEFLRYVLSREGQEAVVREGDYLPLPAGVVREQLLKLN